MTYHINPAYGEMAELIKLVPPHKYTPEHVYCNRRNTVERVSVGDRRFVVKKYRRPTVANQIIYTFFRKNKAQRAFEYALRLKLNDVDTAAPVAYITENKGGIFHTGWFICEYLPYDTLSSRLRDARDEKETGRLLDSYIRFTAELHSKGIYHKDYNPGNILVNTVDGRDNFALIDINQMEFGHSPGIFRSSVSFVQCDLPMSEKVRNVSRYAEIRHFPPALCRMSCYLYEAICSFRRTLKFPFKQLRKALHKLW